ncbi:MAG TPA: retropepsin-like aspartic protease [Pyrinomonadaceae bacterium]|nr:retropepsin-like aspartic protease [Pyrinomonadaceae bacterium]
MPTYDDNRFEPPAPVARVSLRNPESHEAISDIPMLIDTGADMTFIPKAAVVKLNLQFASGEGYKLRAFDGSSSMSKAVKADMLFLGRTVKGRYLVRDAEIGILGRDVLNHFVILLDGPESKWEQQTTAAK